MGFQINTNVAAMNAHMNSVNNNRGLDKSLAALSSGLRINSAADDASGLAIANQLNSQAEGLGQAIRNANDGINVAQTADGALEEYTNIINTVRVKSIQAASDGQNADSRKAIQADIDKLLDEAQNIAKTTSFNGQQLLDGSFQDKKFHIGAYAGETVGMDIKSTKTSEIGKLTSVTNDGTGGGGTAGDGIGSRDALAAANFTETGSGNMLKKNELTINGTDISTSLNKNSANDLQSAKSIAAAITDATGMLAQGTTKLEGGAITAGSIAANSLKINGHDVAATTVVAGDSNGALAKAINDISDKTGVTATSENGSLVLTSNDGSNISVTSPNEKEVFELNLADTAAAVGADTIAFDGATITLADGDGAAAIATKIAAGAYTNYDAAVDATDNTKVIFTAKLVGEMTDAVAGDFTFTDVGGASTDLTAADQAYTVTTQGTTDVPTITGLTDSTTSSTSTGANATINSTATAAKTIAEGELVINGQDMAGTYGDGSTAGSAAQQLEAAIQNIDGFEDSSIASDGAITLKVNNGNDLNIAGSSTLNLTEGITNSSQAGVVEIFAEDKITVGGTDSGSFGFTNGGFTPKSNDISLDSIDVTTREGAEVAIKIADAALKAIDSVRSDIGSTQNQLESTVRNISVTQVNVTAAESTIRDVDFAAESANLQKRNILAQSGVYAMSQANSAQQNVMRLLQ